MDVVRQPELRHFCTDPSRSEARCDGLPEFVRANAYSIPHVVGTCAMGPRPKDGAVVEFPTIMLAGRLSERIWFFP